MVPFVMCIDDDAMTLMLLEFIFEDTQFCTKLVTAINGKEGLDYFENQFILPYEERKLPNMIFLDLNMPVISGWAFLDYLENKAEYFVNPVKVIVLSSSVNPVDRVRAEEHPLVIKFISKPLVQEILDDLKYIEEIKPYFL
jgi:CheY-like chemotaxis protein